MHFSRSVISPNEWLAVGSSITRSVAAAIEKIAQSTVASSPLSERTTRCRCSTRGLAENSDCVETSDHSALAVDAKTSAKNAALNFRTEFRQHFREPWIVPHRIPDGIQF